MTLDEVIRLKTELLIYGMTITDRALSTVGEGGLEKVFWVFEMTPTAHKGTSDGNRPLPNDMLLPYGLYVDVRYSPHSHFTVDLDGRLLILKKNNKEICEVHWPQRPDFYDMKTRSGELMKKVASMRGDCGLRVCFDNSCSYYVKGEQCKFCNIVPARQRNRNHVVTVKEAEDIYDVVKDAIIDNPVCTHLAMTAGAYKDDGLGNLPVILNRLQPLLAEKNFPIVTAITATRTKEETELLCSTGISSVAFNLEIWDEILFDEICPGKTRRVGRQRWIESLKEAQKLLKPGRTLSSFVVGLEPQASLLEGINYLSSEGIWPIMSPFIPMVGTSYEASTPPDPDWIWDAHEKATEIIFKNLPDVYCEEIWQGDVGICPSCTTTKLFFDFMRRIVPRDYPRHTCTDKAIVS
ncbi:MAG TPA: radical SAM protein [Patescibacteria group bacterium]|nr:radical SAM protein [Patescibacteria group bacterium]